ncbi:MAG: hypothetical protein AAGE01_14200 [Pseudomonadota bacterium]
MSGKQYLLRQVLDRLPALRIRARVIGHVDVGCHEQAAFLHVDLTTVPEPFSWAHRFCARCINGRAVSIRRDRYSTARVGQDGAAPGPVIVKSIYNHQGKMELLEAIRQRRLRFPSDDRPNDPTSPYELYASSAAVPAAVWSDPERIVERFVPGSLEPPIVKYRQEFFLDMELNTRAVFDDPLCTEDSMTSLDFLDAGPPEIPALRERLGLDYGSVDYFVEDGAAVIIDVNKTTTFTPAWVAAHRQLDDYVQSVAERLADHVRR